MTEIYRPTLTNDRAYRYSIGMDAATVEQKASAVIERPIGPPAPGQERANEIRQRLQEGSTPHDEFVRENRSKIDTSTAESKIDSAVPVTSVRADGKRERKAGSSEEKRYNRMLAKAEKIVRYHNEGFDALPKTQQKEILAKIANGFKSFESSRAIVDSFEQQLASATPPLTDDEKFDQRKEFYKHIVNSETDFDFQEKVREVYEEAIASGVESPLIQEKAEAVKEAQKRIDGLKKTGSNLSAELGEVQAKLDTFDPAKVKGQELETLKNEIDAILAKEDRYVEVREEKIARLNRTIASKNATLASANGNPALQITIQGEIAGLEGEVDNLGKELGEVSSRERRREALLGEKASLEAQKQSIQTNIDTNDSELEEAKKAKVLADLAKKEAMDASGSSEKKLDKSLDGVYAEATRRWLKDRLAKADEADQKILEQKAEEAKEKGNEEEARLLHALKTMVGDPKNIDKNLLNTYMRTLVDNGEDGAKEAMRKLLESQGMTPAEVDAKLQDTEFVSKMDREVVQRIVALKMRWGKGIKDKDIDMIRNTSWGKDFLNSALEQANDWERKIKEWEAAGVMEKGTFDKIKSKSWSTLGNKTTLTLLGFLIFGIPGAVLLPTISTINSRVTDH